MKIKLKEYPLKLDEVVSWFHSKQRTLAGSLVTLGDIRKRTKYLQVAAAEFSGTGAFGEIDAWISGEFDFHVLRSSDRKDIFFRHVKTSAIDGELESVYEEFLRAMENPDAGSGTEKQ